MKLRESEIEVPVIFGTLIIKRLIFKETQKPPEATMRVKRSVHSSIFDLYSDHDIGQELKAISLFLDARREIVEWVALDLHQKDVRGTGRIGLSAESVLRCALLKQIRQLTYKELSFHLSDSGSFQAFARLPASMFPKKSVLHSTISRITPETWEKMNRAILDVAKENKRQTAVP